MSKMHTLGRIRDKPGDYKICEECRAANWYENNECIECEGLDFCPMDAQWLENYLDCDGEKEVAEHEYNFEVMV